MNLDDHTKRIVDMYVHWYGTLCDRTQGFGEPPTCPKLEVLYSACRAAGRYYPGAHKVQIMLPYAILFPHSTEETVVHELAHAFCKKLMPTSRWHGDFFLFMMRNIAGFKDADAKHRMSAKKAIALGELLVLQTQSKGSTHSFKQVPNV